MTLGVQVKICGITNRADAGAAVDAGAAALGFNFYPPSRRYVTPEEAAGIVAQLPRTVCTVGVFVNEPSERVKAIARQVGLTALQFHGDEAPEFCRGWPQKVIKAIRVCDAHAAAKAQSYAVDFILADAYVEGQRGGTGRRIVPILLEGFERRHLILAGGLTTENVAEVVRRVRPFAVDVASGVERAPGQKDATLMRRFIANAQAS
ncbi:MAG TPA: phosphoribosylanthranilate isomerase [Candidatus Margulisiibacteriota bacterium]|nr:phosphoribosylanthranilate isomerase [Candidatus Margulisiibacteriota bacterium]